MPPRRSLSLAVSVLVVTLVWAMTPLSGQSASRTAWGDPDLQGTWASSGATPMERPDEFQGRETLSEDEVSQIRQRTADRNEQLLNAPARRTVAGAGIGAYNNFWMERGARSNRTSMIVHPPDGRFPPLTPEGEYAKDNQQRGDDTWADRHIWERCVTRGGMPNAMFPRSYNNNIQIFQAPGHVAILLEQVHEVRIVPLDNRPPVSSNIGQWNGVSTGRWDGDTLVVETTNLDHRVSALQPWSAFSSHDGSGEGLTLVERFTRYGDTLEYAVEVNDPQMYTRPWTAAFPFELASHLLYEYACHEGNEGMVGILSGGRSDDAAEASR